MKCALLWFCCGALLAAQSLKQERLVLPQDVALDDWFLVDADGDGVRELLLVDAGQRRLVLLKAPWGAPTRRDIPIAQDVAAFTFADLVSPPGEDLLLLSAQGATLLAGMQGTPLPWLKLELLLPQQPRSAPRCHEWAQDRDGDGHEDILLPGVTQEWLVSCSADGKAGARRAVSPATTVELRRDAAGLFTERATRPRAGLLRCVAPKRLEPIHLSSRGIERFDAVNDKTELLFALPGTASNASGGASENPNESTSPGNAIAQQDWGLVERLECSTSALEPVADEVVLLARTRAEGGRIPEPRTELLLYRLGSQKPAGALLLSGMLSSGPDLVDANGDGRMDLALSVVASGVRGELQRAIGKCPVTWHIYLHQGGAMPWPRSPHYTLTDTLDAATFDRWGTRHRVFLAGDMDADGFQELVRVRSAANGVVVELQRGRQHKDGPFADDVFASCHVEGTVRGYSAVSLGDKPAILVRCDGSFFFVTLQR